MLLAWLALGGYLWFLMRGAGIRVPLPRIVADTLRVRKPAGQDASVSGSDSVSGDDSDPDHYEGDSREVASGAVVVSGQATRVQLVDDDEETQPGLIGRVTSWWERLVGDDVPEVVYETEAPAAEPTGRPAQRDELCEHLRRERTRGLPATLIVKSAANQDDVPWGRVSERAVWRAWAQVCKEEGGA